MWSASTWYGLVHFRSRTAASAAARTLAGSDPMMVCSRFDLFHTGMTSTPLLAARTHAWSCALAWCANRSPPPIEYFPSVSMGRNLRGVWGVVVSDWPGEERG